MKHTTEKTVFDWDEYYALYFRIGMIVSLLIILGSFIFLPKEFIVKPYQLKKEIATIMEQLPPELEKIAEPPPVERPKLAVAAPTEEEVEAPTIAPTEFPEIERRPEHIEIPIVPYWKVEVKPEPVEIPKPAYPENARIAGLEGQVVVKALVDIDGKIIDAELLKSSGYSILDESALKAARIARFTPAKQRDQFVRVWVSIPYKFTLIGQ